MASNAAATSAGSNRSNSGPSSASSASTSPSPSRRATCSRNASVRSRARSAAEGSSSGVSGAASERRYGSCAAVTNSAGSPRRASVANCSRVGKRVPLQEVGQHGGVPAQHDAVRSARVAQQAVERGRLLARGEQLGPRDDDGGDGVQLDGGARDQRGNVFHRAGENGDAALLEDA